MSNGTTPNLLAKTLKLPAILVVDDEDYVADLIALLLEQEGYEVTVAYNGHEALHHISARQFNLIVTDMMMPHGDELFTTISQLGSTHELPIIILSAKQRPKDLAANVQFISKPFDVDVLLHSIRQQVGNADGTPY